MKNYSAIFLLIFFFSIAKGQSKKLEKSFVKDTLTIREIKDVYEKFKPDDYKMDKKMIDTIVGDLRKSGNDLKGDKLKRHERVLDFFEVVQKNLEFLSIYWEEADSLLKNINNIQQEIIKAHNNGFIKDYQHYKELKLSLGYDAILDDFWKTNKKIKKSEKALISKLINFYLVPYLFNWNRRIPLTDLTNHLRNYGDQFGKEKKQEYDLLIAKSENKLRESKNEISELEKKIYNLNKEIEKKHIQINNQNKKISEKKSEISKKEIKINELWKDLTSNLKELDEVKQNFNKKSKGLKELTIKEKRYQKELKQKSDSVNYLSDSVKCLINSINTKNTELDNSKTEKEAAESKKKFLSFLLTSSLLLFMIIIYYHGIRSKRKISKAFSKVTDVKNQLQLKTEELKLSYQELNHRIKNNLQQVSSLIYMQSQQLNNTNAKESFRSLQGRIEAIAIVHQNLYRFKNRRLTSVNIADYIDVLVENIVDSGAEANLHIQDIDIEMDDAIQIGLIINELISNAYKYAFPKSAYPKLIITITNNNNFLNIKIKDNGPGFPNGFSLKNSTSFGLKSVVEPLVYRSEKGKMRIANDNGGLVEIKLPFNKETCRLTT